MKKTSIIIVALYFIVRGIIQNILFIFVISPSEWEISFSLYIEYALILLLITIERDNIEKYYLDKSAIYLIFLFGFIPQRLQILPDVIIIYGLTWLTTFVFITFNFKFLKSIKTSQVFSVSWIIKSFLIGIALTFMYLSPYMFYVKQIPLGISFFVYFIIEFILSFGNAAVIEEPIFRGFLMGALYERGVNDIWIIIIQAVVFDICHLEAFSKPYTFFCVIPIVGLVLGWLTIKTKTITNSLVAHSTFDTIVAMLMYNLQKFV